MHYFYNYYCCDVTSKLRLDRVQLIELAEFVFVFFVYLLLGTSYAIHLEATQLNSATSKCKHQWNSNGHTWLTTQ